MFLTQSLPRIRLTDVKITFLSMNANLAGGSHIVAGHAQRLASRGHQVTVVVRRASGPVGSTAPRFRKLKSSASLPAKRPSDFGGLGLDMRLTKSAGFIVASDVPDVSTIVATLWETAEWAQRFPRSEGARACFVQAHEVFDYLPVARVQATLHALLHKVTASAWLRREIERVYNDHEIDLALNAVDATELDAPPRGRQVLPTIGFVFTQTSWKRVDQILQAIARVVSEVPEPRVRAFRDDGLPTGLGVGERISHTQCPSQQEIADTYRQCDAWVTASVNEGFGLPALEAMACRKPVVATRSGWPADSIRTGFSGFLAEENDLETLLDEMRPVLTLPETQWRSMSTRAHATAQTRTWEQSTNQVDAALRRGIERRL